MYERDKKLFVPNDYEKAVFEIYKNLGIGISIENGRLICKREKCNECRCENADLSIPSSLWQVGDNYFKSKYKLLLVGKVARGEPGSRFSLSDGSSIIDTTGKFNTEDDYHGFEGLKNWGKAYWRYSRDLVQRIYGENGWEYVAFTNMVKCNSSYGKDTTTILRKNNCVGIIESEIKFLKPKNVVFYTRYSYDQQIKTLFDNIVDLELDKDNIAKYNMPLWHFTAELCGQKINGIRVSHPQGKNKEIFLKAITDRLVT